MVEGGGGVRPDSPVRDDTVTPGYLLQWPRGGERAEKESHYGQEGRAKDGRDSDRD